MLRERQSLELSEFLRYLASREGADNGDFPSLTDLSSELGVSVASLREQLEVARALGLVEVKPRVGIRRLPFTFLPAVRQSLGYASPSTNNFACSPISVSTRKQPMREVVKLLPRKIYQNCSYHFAHGPSSRNQSNSTRQHKLYPNIQRINNPSSPAFSKLLSREAIGFKRFHRLQIPHRRLAFS
jgi:DNA-binding transcriptional MocR family regulator